MKIYVNSNKNTKELELESTTLIEDVKALIEVEVYIFFFLIITKMK